MPRNRRRRRDDKPRIDREEMAQDYGFTLAFLKSDDELWDLFQRAVKQTWDAGKFVAELKQTKWFRKNSASARQAITLKYTDPATYKQQMNQMATMVRDTYGAVLGGRTPSRRFVRRYAETALMMGWNEQQLVDTLVESVNMRKRLRKGIGGEAGQLKLQIDQAARAYGFDVNNKFMARNVERILQGEDTVDGVVVRLKERAMSRYAAFRDELEGGATMEEIAEPYRQTMAELLEMNPEQIDLFNGKIKRALQRRVEGKPAPMTLYEFEDLVRRDQRWMHTDQAREQFATVSNELLKSFGLRA